MELRIPAAKSTRVLHVLDKLHEASGVSSVVLNYNAHMDPARYQFDFLTHEPPDPQIYDHIERTGGKVFVMPDLRFRNLIHYINRLDDFFEKNSYRIVHGHIANAAIFYFMAAKRKGVPHRILHSHNTNHSDIPWKMIRNRILTIPSALMYNHRAACSEAAARFLFGESALPTVKILPNAIDLDRFSFDEKTRVSVRQELNLRDAFVIGHVGRFVPQKNHGFIIRFFSKLYGTRSDCILLLVGDGGGRREIEKMAAASGISQSVRFLGIRNDTHRLMQAMDLFVLPSLFEGLPIVGVEAQAAGLPCVFSDTVTREVMIDPQTVFLPLGSPERWAAWIASVRERSGRGQNAELFSRFDIRRQTIELTAYYDHLLKESQI